MAFKDELKQLLADAPASAVAEPRDKLEDCLNYCYEHNLGSLCADKCYKRFVCPSVDTAAIDALLAKYKPA